MSNVIRTLRCLPVVLALMLSACVTLERNDQAMLRQHGVSEPLYDKMSRGARLELADIIQLSQRGLPDPFIIHYLRLTYAVYQLTSDDVSQLEKAHVSKPVIDYLLATPSIYGVPYGGYPYAGYPYDPIYGPYYPPIIAHPGFYHGR